MIETDHRPAAATATVPHPLEPLGVEEMRAAVHLVRHDPRFDDRIRFSSVGLQEPTKDVVLGFSPGTQFERAAFVVLYDRVLNATYEVVASLTRNAITRWDHIPGVQAPLLVEEMVEGERLIKEHPDFQAALAKRGITDMTNVMVEIWCNGNFGRPEEQGTRLVRGLGCWRNSPTDNGFAHPVEGVVAYFDCTRMEVIRVEDHGVTPLPTADGNFDAQSVGPLRADIKPLEIVQPEGPSFEVDGHAVRWQKWQFRIGFNQREGVVLHQIGYEDGGRVRPIVYRASLSEMVVPYGSPNSDHYFKNAFDAGEIGIGLNLNALELGCDCLGEIRYFDAVMADNYGVVHARPNAICMHEEDYGMLWKHFDWRPGTTEVRRSRRLVVSSVATISNYEYGFVWYFYQDGTIQHEVKLTGIMIAGAMEEGEAPTYGTPIGPDIYAVNHQHFFNARLDMAVDGQSNRVYEVHSESAPRGPENPYDNAFVSKKTLLEREQGAQRLVDPLSARCWEVENPEVRNAAGWPVAYRLLPGENVLPFARPEAAISKRAGFMAKHLWVTPFDQDERYAAGDYPHMHAGGAGLPAYTAADRPLVDRDVVLWYTFGANHIPRPEDWPVMPCTYIGFSLKPHGFFDRNPALDVPPSPTHDDHCTHHGS